MVRFIADRLGIGTTNTFEPVVAYPDQNIIAIFGKAAFKGLSDLLYISHYDQRSGGTGYALRQNAAGATVINAASGQNLNFGNNNNTIATINASGLELTGNISGSATSTGSFGEVHTEGVKGLGGDYVVCY